MSAPAPARWRSRSRQPHRRRCYGRPTPAATQFASRERTCAATGSRIGSASTTATCSHPSRSRSTSSSRICPICLRQKPRDSKTSPLSHATPSSHPGTASNPTGGSSPSCPAVCAPTAPSPSSCTGASSSQRGMNCQGSAPTPRLSSARRSLVRGRKSRRWPLDGGACPPRPASAAPTFEDGGAAGLTQSEQPSPATDRKAAPASLQVMSREPMPAARPLELLAERFGFAEFRPGQEQVVDALLAGRSALAVFPTGAGKSLCYQLPALLLEGLTVVVSPLIALMKDQIDFLQRSGIAAARLDSSLGGAEQREIFERLRTGALKLLYVAPERFNNERFIAQLGRTRIGLFAVDEAHCISEWGHNFRPDYLTLAERSRELEAERVLALTATATPAVVADIRAGFGIEDADAVVTGFYRPNLTLLTTPLAAGEKDKRLIERLREGPPGSTIVYVTLQRTSLRVAALLAAAGLPARPYHAGMSPDERVAVQEWWSGSPQAIVVATIAFGMGIDKADVRYVYHHNLPKSLESYSQEIGRAGRDGEASICELLACPDDVPTLENFAFGDTPTRESLAGLLEEVLEHPAGGAFAVSE